MATKGPGVQRSVYRLGHSWVVAVPAAVRAHLKLRRGSPAYWHLSGPREALLTPHEHRVGGKPPGLDLAPQLAAAEREIARLRGRLQQRPQRVFNQGTHAGVAVAQRIGYVFEARLREIAADLSAIRTELGMRPPRPRRRGRRALSPPGRQVEELTLPEPSASDHEPTLNP